MDVSKRKTERKLDFTEMAKLLMFNQPGFIHYIRGRSVRAEYRAGKDHNDVNDAMRKARKNGMGKVEYELDMLELYLKDVFKVYGTLRSK